MRDEVASRLIALNRAFYQQLAEPFSASRERPQAGFHRLVGWLPQPCSRFLDVGCGDGRLGRFLQDRRAIDQYVGLDFSGKLLAIAEATTRGEYFERDLAAEDTLYELGQFEAIASLAVLQHIPGRAKRRRLLREMSERLLPGGRIILSTWQFTENQRQRRKILDWSEVGLSDEDVEANDYLLSWNREGFGLRYVAFIDLAEVEALAEGAGLRIADSFRSDGREGDLNLYILLEIIA